MKGKMKIKFCILIFAVITLSMNYVLADADFKVTAFSCSPSEVVLGNSFTCIATVMNSGSTNGSVNDLDLYSDGTSWFTTSHATSGVTVPPGQTTTVSFSNIVAVKSGDNGFSKIMLDSVTDNYVAEENKKVNVINVDVDISNSASSFAIGGSIIASSEVTAGGNVDVSLSFSRTSGSCTIGSQTNPKTISGMSDGSKQTRTWTITQGATGSCVFTISASATGVGGVASKTYSAPSTITCTDCPVTSTTTSSSGGGAGGAGGGAGGTSAFVVGNLDSAYTVELGIGGKLEFNITNEKHSLTVINITETEVKFEVQSNKQTFTLQVGKTVSVDLNEDGKEDISIFIKSINILSKKANFVITPLGIAADSGEAGAEGKKGGGDSDGSGEQIISKIVKSKYTIYVVIAIIVIAIVIYLIVHLFFNKHDVERFRKSVKVKER